MAMLMIHLGGYNLRTLMELDSLTTRAEAAGLTLAELRFRLSLERERRVSTITTNRGGKPTVKARQAWPHCVKCHSRLTQTKETTVDARTKQPNEVITWHCDDCDDNKCPSCGKGMYQKDIDGARGELETIAWCPFCSHSMILEDK